jgi:hypothetical protein
MNNLPESRDFWANLYDLGKVIAPWATVGVVCWNIVNKFFKYFSDSRDAELRDIVKREVQPKIDEVSRKLDHLSNIIFELKNKK